MRHPVGGSDDYSQARFWLLVYDGEMHPVTWDDGERLLALCAEVRTGVAEPQEFTFTPRGAAPGDAPISVAVRADHALDLITEYAQHDAPGDREPLVSGG